MDNRKRLRWAELSWCESLIYNIKQLLDSNKETVYCSTPGQRQMTWPVTTEGKRVMGNWGSQNFGSAEKDSLLNACRVLSSKAKQAMYGAAQTQIIAQGTWNGCAFNAAGNEINYKQDVTDYEVAAEAFQMPVENVRKFIHTWDRLRHQNIEGRQATDLLIKCLTEVGVFTDPGEIPKKPVRVFNVTVYESEDSKLIKAFQAEIEAGVFTSDMEQAADFLQLCEV